MLHVFCTIEFSLFMFILNSLNWSILKRNYNYFVRMYLIQKETIFYFNENSLSIASVTLCIVILVVIFFFD